MNYKIIIFSLLAGYLSANIFKGIVYAIKNKFSRIGYLNYFILQWFFIRLVKTTRTKETKHQGIFDVTVINIWKGYKILKWVVPFTGWKGSFIYVGKQK